MISANATTINMAKNNREDVEEDSWKEYVCETDCAYPGPPIVLWYVADQPVEIYDGYITNNSIPCDYNGNKTESVLHLKAERKINGKKVKCALENDNTKFNENNLNVTCKYLLSIYTKKVKLKVVPDQSKHVATSIYVQSVC